MLPAVSEVGDMICMGISYTAGASEGRTDWSAGQGGE